MLLPKLIQNSLKHSCAVPVKFFFVYFVSVHVVYLYSSIDTSATGKKSRFNLSDESEFHIIDILLIAVHIFSWHLLISLSVDEMRLLRYVNLFCGDFYKPLKARFILTFCKRLNRTQLQ